MDTEKNLKRNYRVVLTGGPCGGKTTGQSRLCTFFENLGWKVFRVPETATILLSGGIKFSDLSEDDGLKKLDVSTSSLLFQLKSSENKYNIFDLLACFPGCLAAENPGSVAYKFQTHLICSMIQIENTYFTLAESCNRNCLIICDRGFMDALAYVPSGRVDEIMKENGWNFIDMRDNRYHQILHLVSAANGAEEFYSTEDHAVRSECVEIAKNLDKKSAEAWVGHPYFDVVDNSTDFETKMNKMIEFVCQKLGIDTGDRLKTSSRKFKFLVAELPDDSEFPPFQDFDVVHHYLQTSTPEIQARLRKRGQNDNWSYTHTIRRPHIHGKSVEVKSQLTQRDYSNLLANCDNAHFAIYKKRRCFLMNQYFQLDIYQEPSHSRCKGLILLETYSSLSGDDLKNVLPKFLKIVKDVTGDPDYSMFNLSLREDWNKTDRFSHLMHETRYIAWVPSSSALLTNLQNSYSAALKAESILLDKSDLNTSDYEKCNKNMEQKGMEKGRKRKTLPAPQSSSTEEEGDESDDLPCVPVKRYASCHNSTQMLNAFNNKMSSTSADINQNQIMTSSCEVEQGEYQNSIQTSQIINSNEVEQMQTVVEDVPLQIITSPDVQGEHNITIDPSLLSCFNPAVNEQMIRQIIREELDAFENRILKRLEVRSGYITCKAKYIEFEEENKLPLKSIVELQEFDSNLKNDVSLQDKFKSYILQIDGTNAKESIKIINRIYHLHSKKFYREFTIKIVGNQLPYQEDVDKISKSKTNGVPTNVVNGI